MSVQQAAATSSDPALARRLADAAGRFVQGLAPEQFTRAVLPWEAPARRQWTYLPGERPGLVWKDMAPRQRDAALRLLEAGLSPRGVGEVRAVMALEEVLRDLENGCGARRDPEHYWLALFGEPGAALPWGFRLGGHHVSVHFTVVGDRVSATPCFLGAHPATIHHGPAAGTRTLAAEEDLARALLATFDARERSAAVVATEPPDDIATRDASHADPDAPLHGLAWARMRGESREALARLVKHYVERAAPALARREWTRLEAAGLERIGFAWAGSTRRGDGHYYAVTGPDFLVEYDNTQNGANHIHSVWRRFEGDWGADLLAAHYAESHEAEG